MASNPTGAATVRERCIQSQPSRVLLPPLTVAAPVGGTASGRLFPND